MRHVGRTQRIDIDSSFERIQDDPGLFIEYIRTHPQMADIMAKANFTSLQWRALCTLCSLGLKYGDPCAAKAGAPGHVVVPTVQA